MVKTLDWLEQLADSTQSTEEDSRMMQGLLRMMKFHKAVVVCGIVYVDGQGTMQAPPTSIHSMARMLVKAQGEHAVWGRKPPKG